MLCFLVSDPSPDWRPSAARSQTEERLSRPCSASPARRSDLHVVASRTDGFVESFSFHLATWLAIARGYTARSTVCRCRHRPRERDGRFRNGLRFWHCLIRHRLRNQRLRLEFRRLLFSSAAAFASASSFRVPSAAQSHAAWPLPLRAMAPERRTTNRIPSSSQPQTPPAAASKLLRNSLHVISLSKASNEPHSLLTPAICGARRYVLGFACVSARAAEPNRRTVCSLSEDARADART